MSIISLLTTIITSLLEPDFYKFTMGQFVWRHYRNVRVTYAFRCRTKNVHLGRIIDIERLRHELDEVRKLRFTKSELRLLRGVDEYGRQMFCDGYLDFLRDLQLPEYRLEVTEDGDLTLEFSGLWSEAIYWETIALSIVNELYNDGLLATMSPFGRDVIWATARVRLAEKIATLREHPDVIFSDFGSRRRAAGWWQKYIDETLRDELPTQYLGTSNTHFAMETNVMPMGTSAHELQMVAAGLMEGEEDWLVKAQRTVLDQWWNDHGRALSIFLPDTFGSDFFLKNLTEEDWANWKGFRWDSGDPYDFGRKIIAQYKRHGIDSREKMLIPSDGLELPTMIKLTDCFKSQIKVSHGWGTNLTNDLFDKGWQGDLWHGPLSLVIKPTIADGHHLVKLSDNLAKATGRPEDVERYKIAAGYTNTESVVTVY